jgi:hypothetical protein
MLRVGDESESERDIGRALIRANRHLFGPADRIGDHGAGDAAGATRP